MCITCALASLVHRYWSASPDILRENRQPLKRVTEFVNSFNSNRQDVQAKDENKKNLDPEEAEKIREQKRYVACYSDLLF